MDNEETLGCKTGVTHNAGACFSGCFGQDAVPTCIIVVLGCKTMESRWTEVPKLLKWY